MQVGILLSKRFGSKAKLYKRSGCREFACETPDTSVQFKNLAGTFSTDVSIVGIFR